MFLAKLHKSNVLDENNLQVFELSKELAVELITDLVHSLSDTGTDRLILKSGNTFYVFKVTR